MSRRDDLRPFFRNKPKWFLKLAMWFVVPLVAADVLRLAWNDFVTTVVAELSDINRLDEEDKDA